MPESSGGVSRGNFLKVIAAAALAPWSHVSELLAVDVWQASPEAAHLHTAAMFREYLDSEFLTRTGSGERIVLRLASVTEDARDATLEQFSLTFEAASTDAALDGTHRFTHGALGEIDIFVVAHGRSGAGMHAYEACFSRAVFKA